MSGCISAGCAPGQCCNGCGLDFSQCRGTGPSCCAIKTAIALYPKVSIQPAAGTAALAQAASQSNGTGSLGGVRSMYPTATRSRAVVQAFYIPPQRPGFAGNPAINRTSIGNASAHAAAGAALAGPPGAVLGALYGAAGPGPSVVKIAAATALGAMAFGPVGAALGAFATANPHHTMKASMAGVAGAYFANPWMAGLGAAFLGK